MRVTDYMENPPHGEMRGARVVHESAGAGSDSTVSAADVLALSEYAWRSDVLVLVAVQHRNGRWRREPFLSLTGARNRYLKARRNGLQAVMLTCELRVTHGHAKALEHLMSLEVQSGGGDDE